MNLLKVAIISIFCLCVITFTKSPSIHTQFRAKIVNTF